MSMKRVDYVRAQIIVFLTPLLKGVVPVQYMTTFVASILVYNQAIKIQSLAALRNPSV